MEEKVFRILFALIWLSTLMVPSIVLAIENDPMEIVAYGQNNNMDELYKEILGERHGSNDDPFRVATEVTNEVSNSLRYKLAPALLTLILVLTGISSMLGKLDIEHLKRVFIGTLILCAAGGIADLILF